MEAIATRLEAIATRLEAIARYPTPVDLVPVFVHATHPATGLFASQTSVIG